MFSSYCQRISTAFAILLVLLVVAPGSALAKTDRAPVSFQKSTLSLDLVEKRRAPDVDTDRLLAEDLVEEASGLPTPMRFAAVLPMSIDSRESGTWEILSDGSSLWRVQLSSPGALHLNLAFDHVKLPKNSALWIYSGDARTIQGAYSALDIVDPTDFWTPIVLGDELVVELHAPANVDFEPELRIVSLQHGYRAFGTAPEKQGGCNIDVVCSEGNNYRDQIRSVGVYSFGGNRVCTGTMLNNKAGDFKPYFLTAHHCGVDSSNANSIVVYWNYESPTCGALSGGSLNQNQSGATFRARDFPSDFALVELNQTPSASYDVYWAGWDATNTPASKTVAIHHPAIDEKAISFENEPVTAVDVSRGGVTHWKVSDWNVGTTEPGSSGSCLFGQSSKRCVGTLTGGFAACGNDLEDYYGKFSSHWTGGGTNATRLKNWLDPGNTGSLTLDGAEPGGGGGPSTCTPDATTLCLQGGRFKLQINWRDFVDDTGQGTDVGFGSADSGLFWFFAADNWEMLVKVIDGCGFNDNFWVFSAATTNVEYTLTVTDTQTGQHKQYFNPLGISAPAVTDTSAFATCP